MEQTQAAVAAALAEARAHGLRGEGRVVRDLTNVLIHLEPARVIARVPLTLRRLRPPLWFAQEVELVQYLADQGAPVAPPAATLDPGPHERDGFLVSFWDYVAHDPDRADPPAVGQALERLHAALEHYRGSLPTYDRLAEVGELLGVLQPSQLVTQDELDGLRAVQRTLAGATPSVGRPLHGDAHFGNVLWTSDGPLWNDFENACTGPVEYDLACLAWRAAPGTLEALAAYGSYDARKVTQVTPNLALFLAAWTIVVVTRAPTEGGIAEARRRVRRALAHRP